MLALLLVVAADPSLPSYTIDIDQVDSWLRVAGEVIAVVFFISWLRKRKKKDEERKREQEDQEARIIAAVRKSTQPVQPNYRNGGHSLADVASEVRRIKDSLAEQGQLLMSVHKNVTETSADISLHREAVAQQFATFRAERDAIMAEVAAQTHAWRVALESQGITTPPETRDKDA